MHATSDDTKVEETLMPVEQLEWSFRAFERGVEKVRRGVRKGEKGG